MIAWSPGSSSASAAPQSASVAPLVTVTSVCQSMPGLPHLRQARHRRILVEVGIDRGCGGLLDEIGAGEIWEALAEIDRAVLGRQRAHLGEDRGAEAGDAAGKAIGHGLLLARRATTAPSFSRDVQTLCFFGKANLVPKIVERLR